MAVLRSGAGDASKVVIGVKHVLQIALPAPWPLSGTPPRSPSPVRAAQNRRGGIRDWTGRGRSPGAARATGGRTACWLPVRHSRKSPSWGRK